MLKTNRKSESGRSMVEMLGVLAIVGVLSVGGIAGYTTAMNAHRANEAINRVMKLAVLVSGQKLLGQTASLVGVDADNVTLEEDTANGKFTLKVSGLSEPVKNKIQGMDIATADLGTSGDDLTFTFKNDLSDQSTSGGSQGGQGTSEPVTCPNGTTTCTDGKICCPEMREIDRTITGWTCVTQCQYFSTQQDCTESCSYTCHKFCDANWWWCHHGTTSPCLGNVNGGK